MFSTSPSGSSPVFSVILLASQLYKGFPELCKQIGPEESDLSRQHQLTSSWSEAQVKATCDAELVSEERVPLKDGAPTPWCLTASAGAWCQK